MIFSNYKTVANKNPQLCIILYAFKNLFFFKYAPISFVNMERSISVKKNLL